MVNYFREHVPNLSCIPARLTSAALTNLTSAKVATTYSWTLWHPSDIHAFETTEKALTDAARLQLPNLNAQFPLQHMHLR